MNCGQRKPLTGFYRDPRKRSKCRECYRAWHREYQRERVEFLTSYKLERGCMDCGYDEYACALEFDHRPGEIKLFMPHTLKVLGSWQQMLDEIAKCDVVCSNCHRVRTWKREPANRDHDLKNRPEVTYGPYRLDPDQLGLFESA